MRVAKQAGRVLHGISFLPLCMLPALRVVALLMDGALASDVFIRILVVMRILRVNLVAQVEQYAEFVGLNQVVLVHIVMKRPNSNANEGENKEGSSGDTRRNLNY